MDLLEGGRGYSSPWQESKVERCNMERGKREGCKMERGVRWRGV